MNDSDLGFILRAKQDDMLIPCHRRIWFRYLDRLRAAGRECRRQNFSRFLKGPCLYDALLGSRQVSGLTDGLALILKSH